MSVRLTPEAQQTLDQAAQCDGCGEDFADDFTPNVEAFEISSRLLCDDCAEEVFEDNGRFGVGA